MKKRFISLFLSMCLLGVSVPCISAEDVTALREEQALREQEELFMEKQGESLTTYFAVKDELCTDTQTYGGVYIDDDGNLNIMIVNPPAAALSAEETSTKANRLVKDYQNLVAEQRTEDQNIIYHLVTYSLEYLETVQDTLMDHADELKIVSTYIDETKNIIVVGYADDTFEESSVIDFVGESDLFAFERVEKIEEQAIVKNGSEATRVNLSGAIPISIACGAKKGNSYGFITAGHCVEVGENVYYNGTYMGSVTSKIDGGNADVAFIASTSAYKSTTKFTDGTAYKAGMSAYGNGAIHVMGGWPTGTEITTYGFRSGITHGYITSTKHSYVYKDGTRYNNLVQTSCTKTLGGDSGGAVKATIVYQGIKTAYCAGIHHGFTQYSDGTIRQVYTDIDLAKSALGFVGHYDTTGVK